MMESRRPKEGEPRLAKGHLTIVSKSPAPGSSHSPSAHGPVLEHWVGSAQVCPAPRQSLAPLAPDADPPVSWCPTAMPQAPWEKVLPEQAVPQAEECVICFHHAVNSCLVPCGHTHFCSHCAWKVFRDTAKCPMCRWQIKEVAPARAVPVPGTEEGS